jgi:hypothetical protein
MNWKHEPTEHQKQEGKRALARYGDPRDCYDAMVAAAPVRTDDNAIQFGSAYRYHDKWSGRDCYVVATDTTRTAFAVGRNDVASLIVELYTEDGSSHSGELRRTEASALTLVGGAA